MRFLVAALSLGVLGACGGGDLSQGDDGPDVCETTLMITPASPRAGNPVRAIATVNRSGVITYSWQVTYQGDSVDFTQAAPDLSEIEFRPLVDGTYLVEVAVDVPGESSCGGGTTTVAVGESNAAGEIVFRPRVGDEVAPAVYELSLVGNADTNLSTLSWQSRIVSGQVKIGTTNEAAFLRFSPGSSNPPTPPIEAFTDATGSFSVPVGNDTSRVVVVPSTSGIPWHSIATSATTYTLSTGYQLFGTVRGPTGALLAGARVQVIDDFGAASTVGTTNASGAFTINHSTPGPTGTITVTPPAASGLPRLTGSTVFGTSTIDVRYNTALVMRDAGGTQVMRSGPLGNASVIIVGSLDDGGTVTAANGPVDLVGTVRIVTTTMAGGALPALQVPAAALSAVVSPSAGDFAVAAFDTTTSVPSTITAPVMTPFSTQIVDFNGNNLGGAQLALESEGALELAGVPALTTNANAAGLATGSLATGGMYRLRATDPEGRAGGRIDFGVKADELGLMIALPRAVFVTGALKRFGSEARLQGATVEIYCAGCSKDPGATPLAQGITDAQGSFSLAVAAPEAQ